MSKKLFPMTALAAAVLAAPALATETIRGCEVVDMGGYFVTAVPGCLATGAGGGPDRGPVHDTDATLGGDAAYDPGDDGDDGGGDNGPGLGGDGVEIGDDGAGDGGDTGPGLGETASL